jgi:Cu(I)/Ag(I) efflux system membrane fusion protein
MRTVLVLLVSVTILALLTAGVGGSWGELRAWIRGESGGAAVTMWCPMDPEIVRKGAGACPICSMDLVPFEGGAATESGVLVLTDRQVQQAGVRLGSARVRDLVREIDATGRLEVTPMRRASFVLNFPGKSYVERVHVHAAGTVVNEGKVVAEVENPRMQALLEEYRGLLDDYAGLRRRELTVQAREKLEEVNELRDRFVEFGVPGAYLGRLAVTPKHLYSDALFPVIVPYTGTLLTEPGLYPGLPIDEGRVLFELADLTELWLYIELYDHERPLVGVGQAIEFTTLAVPDKTYQTKIRFIEPIVEERTQTVRARARVWNQDGLLAPGMFVPARIACPIEDALSVPASAVLQSGRRSVVIVSEGEGRFRPRLVELGRRHLGLAQPEDADSAFGSESKRHHEVLSGVNAGERVVVAGNFLLNAEAQFQGVLEKMIAARDAQDAAGELSPETANVVQAVLTAYFALGDALVQDDPGLVPDIGKSLATSAAAVAPNDELAASLGVVAEAGRAVAAAAREEPDWDVLRTEFGTISREVVHYLRDYAPARISEGELFLFRCPMADGFGYELWVQDESGIANPYMGQWMPECGAPAELE